MYDTVPFLLELFVTHLFVTPLFVTNSDTKTEILDPKVIPQK